MLIEAFLILSFQEQHVYSQKPLSVSPTAIWSEQLQKNPGPSISIQANFSPMLLILNLNEMAIV